MRIIEDLIWDFLQFDVGCWFGCLLFIVGPIAAGLSIWLILCRR